MLVPTQLLCAALALAPLVPREDAPYAAWLPFSAGLALLGAAAMAGPVALAHGAEQRLRREFAAGAR